jgi:hypothetical protein
MQREPTESHGARPVTTLNGSVEGTLKAGRNASTNRFSKSRGSVVFGSCGATFIFTIVTMESLA